MPICKHEEFLSLINFKNRILGFDHGTKKIGVAISDENLTLASPLKTIIRNSTRIPTIAAKLALIFTVFSIF